jgi:hypothetical protein
MAIKRKTRALARGAKSSSVKAPARKARHPKKKATSNPKRSAAAPSALAPEQQPIVVDRRTDERRDRVLQLWGKKDAHIAKLLLEEGFEVNCGEPPIGKDLQDEWLVRRQETMRRNVNNDRAWWCERWREKKSGRLSPEDAVVERESHVAALRSDIDEIQDLVASPLVKATAKAMLIGERRQSRVAIAKARGIETLEADEMGGDEGGPRVRKVLVLDLSRCSAEEKEKYGVGGGG